MKPKNFAWLVQKAAELGVSQLWPLTSDYVQHRPERHERLVKIANGASQQAFRNYPLQVHSPTSFKEALQISAAHKYILDEKLPQPIKTSFEQDSLFLVGPEGGWSEKELELAKASGFERVYLGPRIMRAETASLFVLARVKI
ncbi:RsmE family RNA methyltransferase [Mycoplasma sp. ATU-Cv-508]|uniref:RsmE family RNA methyltransferase n=1 Tax=Mycoplasma sp. ATU-Cv-508 TaxID=2048001 RepID=UPI000FDE97F7